MIKPIIISFIFCFSVLSGSSQIMVLDYNPELKEKVQFELDIPSDQLIIVYPLVKVFSTKIIAAVDYGQKRRAIRSIAYLSFSKKKEKKNKTKIKTKKKVFDSEANILNYFVSNGYTLIDGEPRSFIFQKK